jgi:hypothetical protein
MRTTDRRDAIKDSNLPLSALSRWRERRRKEVEIEKEGATPRDSPSYEPTRDPVVLAQRESYEFHDDELGCGPITLELIQARWNLSQAIAVTLKEYRMYSRLLLELRNFKP